MLGFVRISCDQGLLIYRTFPGSRLGRVFPMNVVANTQEKPMEPESLENESLEWMFRALLLAAVMGAMICAAVVG